MSNYPMINADIFIGAFAAREYFEAIQNPHLFADAFINQFERDIDIIIDLILDDSKDDLVTNFEFIIPSQFVDNSAFEVELYDEMHTVLFSSDMRSALKRAYESAIAYIEFTKGMKLI